MLALPALLGSPHRLAQGQGVSLLPDMAPHWALPLWTAQGTAARELTSQSLLGQWVYLDFWASWCGPCKQSFPWMSQLQHKWRDHPLQVVAVSLDKQAGPMQRFLLQFPEHVAVVWDPSAQTAKQFGVQAMPSSYLINPRGQVVWQHRGFQAADSQRLMHTLGQLLQPASVPAVSPGLQAPHTPAAP